MSTRTLLVGARFIVPSSLLTQSRLISAADIRNPLGHPVRNRRIHLIELPHKKMIGVFHHDELAFVRQRGHKTLHFVDRAINIIRSVHEELRLCALRQKRKVSAIHWGSKTNQYTDSNVLATNSKSDPATETESRNQKWKAWKFRSEKIERRAHITAFPFATIVLAFALPSSAKIETQHRKS